MPAVSPAMVAIAAAVLVAFCMMVAAQGCVPSDIRSSTTEMVIVCAVFQFAALKVNDAGVTLHSVRSVLAKSRMMGFLSLSTL